MENSKQEIKDTLEAIMCSRVNLIANYLKEGKVKFAKIETRALKAYLDCQILIAMKEAKKNQKESLVEEVESK